jgi:hypothetical protein
MEALQWDIEATFDIILLGVHGHSNGHTVPKYHTTSTSINLKDTVLVAHIFVLVLTCTGNSVQK